MLEDLFTEDEYYRNQRKRVQEAQCEQTLHILRQPRGRNAHREDQFEGARSASRGARYSQSFSYGGPSMVLCPAAFDLLRTYRGETRLVRGDSTTFQRTGRVY